MNASKGKLSKLLYLIPVLHFLASFAYERIILIFDADESFLTTVSKNGIISFGVEKVIGYVLSKLIVGIIIFLFWKLVFYVAGNFKKSPQIRLFSAFYVLGFIFLLFLWPDSLFRSIDNLVTYADAIRFVPDYWHSAYTSFVYCAFLMFFPNPLSITFMQWTFFVFDLAYISIRIRKLFPEKKAASYLVFTVFLIPESLILMSDPYRTEIYALSCLFLVSKILLDTLENIEYKKAEAVALLILCAFVCIWRSEGIILGGAAAVFLIARSLISRNKENALKKVLPIAISFIIAFIALYIPQKVGDVKYYGSDYNIINSFAVLHNTFNREDSNLTYEGAEKDISAIDKVVPIEALRLYGMEGYRRNNVLNGHTDINQSITSFEDGKAYTKAFHNIALHNPKAYVLTQAGMLKVVFRLAQRDYIEKIHGNMPLSRDYPDYDYPAWENGRADLFDAPGVNVWYNNKLRVKIKTAFDGLKAAVNGFCRKIYLETAILVCISLFEVFILIREACFFFSGTAKKKDKQQLFVSFTYAFFALILLLQAFAIAIVMPAGVTSYFRTFFVCAFAEGIIYLTAGRNDGKRGTDKKENRHENSTLSDNMERA